MCEIAIMVHDIVHDDPVADSKMFKAGDIIDILEDGADWGDHAIAHSHFRMIRLTGISRAEAMVLLHHETSEHPYRVSRTLRERKYMVDLTLIDRQFLADDARTHPVLVLSSDDALALFTGRITKDRLPDPDVIGE